MRTGSIVPCRVLFVVVLIFGTGQSILDIDDISPAFVQVLSLKELPHTSNETIVGGDKNGSCFHAINVIQLSL